MGKDTLMHVGSNQLLLRKCTSINHKTSYEVKDTKT
jgi:hypothetical protein